MVPRGDPPLGNNDSKLDCQTSLTAHTESKSVSNELTNPPTALRNFESAAAYRICERINGALSPEQLDHIAIQLIQSWGAGAITDHDAEVLHSLIERRRPFGVAARASQKQRSKLAARLSRFLPRHRARSPNRKASRDRRRMLGGSSALPSSIRHYYTEGQRAALCVVAGEIKRQGFCDLALDAIAARAGVCRTSVQDALHEARRMFHLKITERPRPGRKNLTNVVEIISPEWRRWLWRNSSAGTDRVQNFENSEPDQDIGLPKGSSAN